MSTFLGNFNLLDSLDIEEGTCGVAFSVLAAEPATLDLELIVEHRGTAMGAGSSAIQVGGQLFIGTFAGDRLARTPFPSSRREGRRGAGSRRGERRSGSP